MKAPVKIVIAQSDTEFSNTIVKYFKDTPVEFINPTKQGKTALRAIVREKPEFAILDYSLSSMLAFDIIDATRKKGINTKFCVFYYNATLDDYLLAESLGIESNLIFSPSVSISGQMIKDFIEGKRSKQAFDTLPRKDAHKEQLINLNPNYLELLTLLGLYGELKPVTKKIGVNKEQLEVKVKEICKILKFKDWIQLSSWCREHQRLILNLAIKAA
ncbi:MAG: hypothetical protein ACSHW7_11215 [Patiriisocius sp.]|uniref:hypothetical protein n=1 Tax=Patiriisocius sp. TaxID=2822396 RepID=UPI003EF8CF7C